MANIVTGFRITASLALLFCQVFSIPFYALYLTAGISDMVDGIVARRTNTASEFGAKLDTAADFVFVTVCLIRLLPVVEIPAWMCVWIGVIALIKGMNIVSGYVKQEVCGCTHGHEQGHGGAAVCSSADGPACRAEGYRDDRLRNRDVRRGSGGIFDSHRE